MGATTFIKCQQNNSSTVGVKKLEGFDDPNIQLRERTFIKSIMKSVKKEKTSIGVHFEVDITLMALLCSTPAESDYFFEPKKLDFYSVRCQTVKKAHHGFQ